MSDTKEYQKIQETADQWLVRMNSGIANAEINSDLKRWLECDPRHQQAYENAKQLWQQLGQLHHYPPFRKTLEPHYGYSDRSIKRLMPNFHLSMAVAACLALITLMMPWLNIRLNADHRTAVGETKSLQLADGSMLYMNTQTAIAVNYSQAERKIRLLEGEAEFVVAKDTNRPFIVSVGDETIKALGTDFIVRCEHDQLTVTQLESRVEIRHPAHDQALVLNPGEQLQHQHGHAFENKNLVDIQKVSAWRRGKLVFESTPLATVVAEINRYRSGRIVLIGEKQAQLPVSGVFDVHHLNKFPDVLKQTLAVQSLQLSDQLTVIY